MSKASTHVTWFLGGPPCCICWASRGKQELSALVQRKGAEQGRLQGLRGQWEACRARVGGGCGKMQSVLKSPPPQGGRPEALHIPLRCSFQAFLLAFFGCNALVASSQVEGALSSPVLACGYGPVICCEACTWAEALGKAS